MAANSTGNRPVIGGQLAPPLLLEFASWYPCSSQKVIERKVGVTTLEWAASWVERPTSAPDQAGATRRSRRPTVMNQPTPYPATMVAAPAGRRSASPAPAPSWGIGWSAGATGPSATSVLQGGKMRKTCGRCSPRSHAHRAGQRCSPVAIREPAGWGRNRAGNSDLRPLVSSPLWHALPHRHRGHVARCAGP
jgi:hypothetical protein